VSANGPRRNTKEAKNSRRWRSRKRAHHGRLAAPGVPAYLYMRELIQQGYVGQVLA